jgi:site-specific recombinase XerD
MSTTVRPTPRAVRVEVKDGDIAVLARSYERHLAAEGLSPHTIRIYTISVAQMAAFLKDRGMPLVAANITREHLEEWLLDILARRTPGTARARHRGAKSFFTWLLEEGEIPTSPMARLKQPKDRTVPPTIMSDADVLKLFKTCGGTSFESRRDYAILRLLFDTGARRSEVTYLNVDDVDLDELVMRVVGKGNRVRLVPFGRKTAAALDRYLRVRVRHKDAASSALWIGRQGALQDSAVDLMLRRRARQAGLVGVHAHLFRHGFAHRWLAAEGQERDLMQLGGWRSAEIMARYGSSAAAERARSAYRRLSPGDRL